VTYANAEHAALALFLLLSCAWPAVGIALDVRTPFRARRARPVGPLVMGRL